MYGYIKGKVSEIKSKYIVLENNNIGYEIVVGNPFSYVVSDKEIMIYTYYLVKEDSISLYGFSSSEEKDLFLTLISVSGIGPKSAMSIITGASVNEIVNAINNKDVLFLKKFPGIGLKASQQIILDLSGKLDLRLEDSNTQNSCVLEALESLGYNKKDVIRVLKEIDTTKEDSLVIKEALRKLNK